jgi:23S rRNA A2030 N6-methylase RlmJ
MSVVVKYIDLDNNSAELASSETLNGKVGERVNYHTAEEVQKLIAAGYVLVNNPFDLNNEVHFLMKLLKNTSSLLNMLKKK